MVVFVSRVAPLGIIMASEIYCPSANINVRVFLIWFISIAKVFSVSYGINIYMCFSLYPCHPFTPIMCT